MSWSLIFPRCYLSQCRLSCVFVSRWPRTLAGITAYLQCTRNAHGSGIYPGNAQDERKAWRRCDRGGFWADDDYSRCQYANDVTRVLYMFNQVTGKSSGLLRLLIRRGAHTKYILFFFFLLLVKHKDLVSVLSWTVPSGSDLFFSTSIQGPLWHYSSFPGMAWLYAFTWMTCHLYPQTESQPFFKSTWEAPSSVPFIISLSQEIPVMLSF